MNLEEGEIMKEENVSRADRVEEALDTHGADVVRHLFRLHHLTDTLTKYIVLAMVGFFALYGFVKFRHVLPEIYRGDDE